MSLLSVFLTLMLSLTSPPSDSVLLQQSRHQVNYFISQIQDGKNADLHLWALAQLCDSNKEISVFINNYENYEGEQGLPFRPFCIGQSSIDIIKKLAFDIQSPDLLIAALLDEQKVTSQKILLNRYTQEIGFPRGTAIQYQEIAKRIIQGRVINADILPYNTFEFTHFLLFYNSDLYRNGVLPVKYLRETSTYWLSSNPSVQKPSLEHSLFRATLFRALYLTDEYAKTEPLYRSLVQDKLFPVSSVHMSIYRALDYSMYRLGYYDRSLDITRNFSVPFAKFLDKRESKLSALVRQGAYLIKIGKIEEAQKINLEVFEQAKKYDINLPQATLYNNLGITYERIGDFDKYLELLFRALDEAKKQDNYSNQLNILNNLYLFYRQNNDPNSALLYLEAATNLAQDYGNQEDLGIIYSYLGTFYKKFKNDYTLSLEYFSRAESVLDQDNHFDSYLNLLYEKGKLYEEMKDYDLALNMFEEVISLSQSKSVRHYFESLSRKTAVHLKLGEIEQVGQLVNEINSHDFSQFDFNNIIKAKTVHADYLLKTGRSDEAYAVLKPVIHQTVSWAQSSTDLQSGFWNVEQEFLEAFQLMADLLIDSGRMGEAVEVLDKLKTINDAALYQNPMVKSSLLSESELSQYQRLNNRLDELRKRLLATSPDNQMEIQTQIDQLSARKRMLDRKITTMADSKPATVQDVQNTLDAYQTVLHITELNDWYYIATIFRNEVSFSKVRLDSSLRSVFSRSVEQLASGKTNLNDLYQISETLGLQDLPSWTKKVTIIPDSYLYQLPVDILPLSKPASGHSYGGTTYLIERFSTNYLTSLNDFNLPAKSPKDYKWDFIGYGISDFQTHTNPNLMPLPYAQTEVSTILAGLTNLSNKTIFLDSLSTEAAFKATAPNARILHLATHSEVSERDPLLSSIYLSQHNSKSGTDFPGQIFAYELFELNLSNDLIMLNSCESGSGDYLQGSGIMGISRALRYAGANSLILNLWSVNDMMASGIAVHFYDNLNDGKTKADALRAAKLHMLKSNNANPHYWGTYMLIGTNNAVVKPFEKTNIYLASSFVLYFILLITVSIFIKEKSKRVKFFS